MIRIGLVGNPNSGKTTIFNRLTGSNQYVGNWPGVTVEKKEGKINNDTILVDLPGIYSLSPYSLEEVISRDFLLKDQVDVLINIVDATNIERNLYLTTQLMEINIPIVIALNMMDLIEKRKDLIDIKKLEAELGIPVVAISALKGNGLKDLVQKAISISKKHINYPKIYSLELGYAIDKIRDLTNTSYFEAIKLIEKDKIILEKQPKSILYQINSLISAVERNFDDDSESVVINERYQFVEKIVSKCVVKKKMKYTLTPSDKIDLVLTNKWMALPIFALVMFVIYYISISTVGDLTISFIEDFFSLLGNGITNLLININAGEWLISLIVDGIIAGVGAVLTFVPQLMILFLFLSILEDSGYMSRVAFIMDRLFRKFGLSGKSFIPMLIGTGCSVPAIMATRTIENEQDRKMTIMLTPFIPCGAKLPVFALLVGAFFSPIAATSVYFLGIFTVIITGVLLKKTKYFKGKASTFLMELPEYRIPSIKNVSRNVWDRTRSFIVKAGTIIFVASAIIWFLSSFSIQFTMVDDASESILASLGRLISWIFVPLGFGNWQATVALLSGMVAKENIISTFGIVLKLGSDLGETSIQLQEAVKLLFNNNGIAAFSFMAFILLASPCFAAIATTKKEMGSRKLMWFTILFQTFVAYIVSLIIYQTGTLWVNSSVFKTGVIAGVIIVWFIYAIRYSLKRKKQNACSSCSKCDSKSSNKCSIK